MKSEKAKIYLHQNGNADELITVAHASVACAMAEEEAEQRVREELTTWHYTKDRLPDKGRLVNAIIGVYDNDLRVIVAHYDLFGWWMCPTPTEAWASCPYDIIKWRYIQ